MLPRNRRFFLFLGRFRNDNSLPLSNLLFSTGDHDAWSIDGSESEIKDPAYPKKREVRGQQSDMKNVHQFVP